LTNSANNSFFFFHFRYLYLCARIHPNRRIPELCWRLAFQSKLYKEKGAHSTREEQIYM
jgi:hypothetical protein